jgi:ribosome-associated translation inhibitor RaiA
LRGKKVESWVISLIIAFAGVLATFAVTKNKVENNDKQIEAIFKILKSLGEKVDTHSESLSEYKVEIKSTVSMKEVRAEFVSKELFKHIDEKFDKLENGIEKILNKLGKA